MQRLLADLGVVLAVSIQKRQRIILVFRSSPRLRGLRNGRYNDIDDMVRRPSSRTRGTQVFLQSRLSVSWLRIPWLVGYIRISACMVHAVMMMKPIQLSWHASLHLFYATTSRCLRRSRYARANRLMISTQIYSVEDQAIWQSILGKWWSR